MVKQADPNVLNNRLTIAEINAQEFSARPIPKPPKIAFFSELPFTGKVSRQPDRTEFAWMGALEATHINLKEIIK